MSRQKTKNAPTDYYFVRIPKKNLAFLEYLKIPKSIFLEQACISFMDLMPENLKKVYFTDVANVNKIINSADSIKKEEKEEKIISEKTDHTF
ncbi:MAG: hypothetical protein QXI16_02425 [Sulfolobaceae archaeon]